MLLGALLLIASGVFSIRLYGLQISQGEELREVANNQYYTASENTPYSRGSIFFTEKGGARITAAGINSGYILAINPSKITDPQKLYSKLNEVVTLDYEAYLSKSSKKDDPYEELRTHLSQAEAEEIKSLELEGVTLVKEQWRFYPANALGAQIVGFVGFGKDGLKGQYGVEHQFDQSLSRESTSIYKNFFKNLFSDISSQVLVADSERKADINLTIEPRVQAYSESVISDVVNKWHAKSGSITIIDPVTGEIVALAMSPTFDPNKYSTQENAEAYSNNVVEKVYEMGSIMKPLTIAAGLDSGAINTDSTYLDKGVIELDGKVIGNYDKRGRGTVGLQDILNQSLNTGTVFVVSKMGHDRYLEYLKRYGFFDRTGIDLPNEANNLVSNLTNGKDVEYATASFGQGIAVSPISMTRALASLANGGYLIKPQIVKSVDYTLGGTEVTKVTEQGRTISNEASEEVTRMLVNVVDKYLANGKVRMEHYSIAAKTGTAELQDSLRGGYYTDRYLHTFFGYFPAYKPRFLVLLILEEPRDIRYASETLSMPFKDTVEYLINYYQISPDR